MNPDIFRDAHPHVQEEFGKLRELAGAQAKALELAVADLLAGRAVEGPTLDLIDDYLKRGWQVHLDQLPLRDVA